MLQTSSSFFLYILIALVGYQLIIPWLSKDKTKIWSPITVISLTLIYYVIEPSFGDISLYGASIASNQYMFYMTAVLFFISILIGFRKFSDGEFSKWNNYFTSSSSTKYALYLFFIALVCYVPFRGFRTSISASDAVIVSERTGFVSYFIDLISLFVGASCLAFVSYKNKNNVSGWKRIVIIVILYFTLVMFIVGGFRYRLVILLLALATTYHLYPIPRKINYTLLLPIAIVTYLGFAIMDSARSYGRGINLDVAKSISLEDASKGAGESTDVLCYSIVSTDIFSREGGFVGIDPIVTAVCMPIPRALFPWKPDATYLHIVEKKIGIYGSGAAFLVFTEAYTAMGLFGVILYGLFIGWLSKKIWSNYQNNKDSIGAILLLAIFNGFCYTWISRGYMASAFNDFIYFVVLPFWLTALINRFSKNKS